MTSTLNAAVSIVRDRVRLKALLVMPCFAGALVLESRSVASCAAYLLAIGMPVAISLGLAWVGRLDAKRLLKGAR